VAPDNPRLGIMLPYSPLHHLLMDELGFPVVATSGNRGDEPIVTDPRKALDRLRGIADLFLVHDRPIARPVDDSVVQVVCGAPQLLRRARGFAPAPVATGGIPDGILACGGHLKTTVALSVGGNLVLSQHLGDLENALARDAHECALDDLVRIHEATPRLVACDEHPDYASGAVAAKLGLPQRRVQHHVAHVAACMAEHGLEPPVLGVAWDGTGYGADGTIWGGEFLLVTDSRWTRAAHLRPFHLAGGDAAAREPRRAALGLLYAAFGDAAFDMTDLAPVGDFTPAERKVLRTMLSGSVNAPSTTSAGRLLEGLAALCGLRQRASYEGQAAASFEWAAERSNDAAAYDLALAAQGDGTFVVDWQPMLARLLADRRADRPIASIARAVHDGLAPAIAAVATRLGERRVVLTGGCFQNRRLTESTVRALRDVDCIPYWHQRIPPNDGGLAAGQVAWVARQNREALLCA
jgi:hydrogenase maturation protein HypF